MDALMDLGDPRVYSWCTGRPGTRELPIKADFIGKRPYFQTRKHSSFSPGTDGDDKVIIQEIVGNT